MPACDAIVNDYIEWLRQHFEVSAGQDGCSIITPFLAPDADHIEVRAFMVGDLLCLGDDGYALNYLFSSGLDVERTSTKSEVLDRIYRSNGVMEKETELFTIVSNKDKAPEALHRLLRAIDQVIHLAYTVREAGHPSFREDVTTWLTSHRITFAEHYQLFGKAKLHTFDLYFPKPKKLTVGRTLSTSSSSYAKRLATDTAFSFVDLRENKTDFVGLSIIDDRQDVWEGEPLSVLTKYSTHVIRWTRNEALLDLVG